MSNNIFFILMMVTILEMAVLFFFGFINLRLKKAKHSNWKIVSSKTMTVTIITIAVLFYAVAAPVVVIMGMDDNCWISYYPAVIKVVYTLFYLIIAVCMHSILCMLGYMSGGMIKKMFLQKKQKQLNHRRKELLSRSYETRRREQEEYFSALQTINAWAEMSEA